MNPAIAAAGKRRVRGFGVLAPGRADLHVRGHLVDAVGVDARVVTRGDRRVGTLSLRVDVDDLLASATPDARQHDRHGHADRPGPPE
jgi:hypothetical protein